MIDDTKNDIYIADIINNDDGSANVTIECSPETYNKIFEFGFIALLMKGIEVDTDADG